MEELRNIIGIRRVEFQGNDNTNVKGYTIWSTFENPHFEGVACERLFFTDELIAKCGKLEIGMVISLVYNRFGKVASYQIC